MSLLNFSDSLLEWKVIFTLLNKSNRNQMTDHLIPVHPGIPGFKWTRGRY